MYYYLRNMITQIMRESAEIREIMRNIEFLRTRVFNLENQMILANEEIRKIKKEL